MTTACASCTVLFGWSKHPFNGIYHTSDGLIISINHEELVKIRVFKEIYSEFIFECKPENLQPIKTTTTWTSAHDMPVPPFGVKCPKKNKRWC